MLLKDLLENCTQHPICTSCPYENICDLLPLIIDDVDKDLFEHWSDLFPEYEYELEM